MAVEQTPADWQASGVPAELSSQTFEFGKRTFVSGLFWQPLPGSTARQRKAELQKMSVEQGFDLAVLRTSGVPQVGFGSLADGVKPGMLSVAAMVSKSLEMANRERSFLCAMPVPGGKWLYVAQREGVLLHDGDLLGNEETVRERMMTDLSLTEWQTVFAPANWGIPDTMQRPFEDLLPKSGSKYSFKTWWEVRPIRNTWLDFIQDNMALYAVLIAVAAGLTGYYLWDQWRVKKELEALAQQEAMEQATREAAAADRPWKKQPRAPQFVAACDSAMRQVKTFWPGNWTPTGAICADRTLTVTWTRQEQGWLEHIREIEPRVEFSPDGNRATLNLPLEMPPGEDETLPKESERRFALHSAAQHLGLQLAQVDQQANAVLGQPAVPGSWTTMTWTITNAPLPPATVISALDGGGFRITQLKLGFAGGMMTWTMEGTQYAQP